MSPSAFRANPNGPLWLPDQGVGPDGGWTPLIGRAVRGEPAEGSGPPSVALTATGEERVVALDPALAGPAGVERVIDAVFVYGTLMTGEGLHEHLHAAGDPGPPATATTGGVLFDLGAWPALLPSPGSARRVRGQLFRPRNTAPLLEALDGVEDFFGYGAEGSLFRRIVLEVEVEGSERSQLAWGYRGLELGGAEIMSGGWGAH
jgi:gamma-glutamylcyclotransferase (GGCT)/AIG2-like uncharacterized protein YtfP